MGRRLETLDTTSGYRMHRTLSAALLIAVLSLLPAAALAQGFHSVYSQDGEEVWAVGDAGVIYRSINSGADLMQQNLSSTPLRGVWATDVQVVVISDLGRIWRSTDYGNVWSFITLPGSPDLRGLEMPSSSIGYAVGAAGTIAKSTDGGASWTVQTSGTGMALEAVSFTDVSNGWAVGASGTVLKTTNGGTTWSPVAVGTTGRLRTVDATGSTIWIGGDGGVCMKSTNSGANWQPVNLRIDSRAEVRRVWVVSASEAFVAGGGGFVRRTTDGGLTWTYGPHDMHGQISSMAFVGTKGWFVSSRNRMVYRTSNSGTTWNRPLGSTFTRAFVKKPLDGDPAAWAGPGTVRGRSFNLNPIDRNTIYTARCNSFAVGGPVCSVYVSRNGGDTWGRYRALPSGAEAVNAFLISPKDSNLWVAAATILGDDEVIRSTDGGTSWAMKLSNDFGTYGIPLEMHPDKPDTLYFGGDADGLWRSTNFGNTWASLTADSAFRSPCDIVAIPDSANILLVGDGETGFVDPPPAYFRSTDGGVTFDRRHSRVASGASEIPGMSNSRLRNGTVFGTNWATGGVQRSTDYGATWASVLVSGPPDFASSMWGTDISSDDPNLMVAGQFGGGGTFISINGGTNFMNLATGGFGSNYSYYLRDRETILAEQSTGIYKMSFSYSYTPVVSQSLSVISPNGGELWAAGSVHTISFANVNVPLVRIEYRTAMDQPWLLIAERPGSTGGYSWTVPFVSTFEAEVRVRDAWDAAPEDLSDGEFTIALPLAATSPPSLAFGTHPKGSTTVLPVTLENTGSGILMVTSVTTIGAGFTEGRNAFSVLVGSSDTIGVAFRPAGAGSYSGTLQISNNGFGTPLISIPLSGTGVAPFFTALPNPLDLGEWNPGATAKDTIRIENHGTATLTINNITSNKSEFWPGRTSFSIPSGGSDTVRIFYKPTGPGADTATVSVFASDTTAAHLVTVYGEGRASVAVDGERPIAFGVWQNRPNPFRDVTEIRYALPEETEVEIEVFDLQGHRVATLVRQKQGPGNFSVPFGSRIAARPGVIPAGVYFYRITAGSFQATRKMLMLR